MKTQPSACLKPIVVMHKISASLSHTVAASVDITVRATHGKTEENLLLPWPIANVTATIRPGGALNFELEINLIQSDSNHSIIRQCGRIESAIGLSDGQASKPGPPPRRRPPECATECQANGTNFSGPHWHNIGQTRSRIRLPSPESRLLTDFGKCLVGPTGTV